MPTDDERREVAARLRELRPNACFDDVYEALGAYGPSPYESRCLSATGFARHLADLIEPSCDREGLLKLANGIEYRAKLDIEKRGPHYGADEWLATAARIREALGVGR